MREEKAKLIGRIGDEYWFVDSVFKHGDGLAGCTGCQVYPVSADQADEALSFDNMADRYADYWAEQYKDAAEDDCENCGGYPDEDGCENCGYPSLESLCNDIARADGYDAVFDFPGHEYTDILEGILVTEDDPDAVEFADCGGCGRIFGHAAHDFKDRFDEVYDRKALVAILAYEDGAVDYEYACKAIYGE